MSQKVPFDNLKELLSEVAEPILFKNILSATEGPNCWKLLDWSLDDFAAKCGDSKLPFRVGTNTYTTEPQWEVNTEIEHKTMKEFLEYTTTNNDVSKWFYFDYKHMNKWFIDKPEIMESFNWQKFDLDLGGADSTIWIGSKGAHTNCHQDTYGYNLVAQTHGRKMWILFSPECTNSMQPTRIPYEESTIYSKYNFFSPSQVEIQAIQSMQGTVKIVTLDPKDVLYIPKGWWHYVESLETTLSVNIWVPLKEDCVSRLKEALVHLVVNTIGDGIPQTEYQSQSSLMECFEILENSIKECKSYNVMEETCKKQTQSNLDITNILQFLKIKYSNDVQLLPDLTTKNIHTFTKKNIVTRNMIGDFPDKLKSDKPLKLELFKTIVDAFSNSEVVQKISQILIEKLVER